jgi:hypothetical protein
MLIAVTPEAPEEIHVRIRETVRIADPQATAAFSLQSDIVEASVGGGFVSLHARAPGSTVVSVVSGAEVRTFEVVVDTPMFAFAPSRRTDQQKLTRYEAYYQSQTGQLSQELEVVGKQSGTGVRAHLVNAWHLGPRMGQDARMSFPVASLELSTPKRTLVLLDAWVDHSPLTLDGISLRGAHYRGDGLEVHAGVTSPLLFQSFLLTQQREPALGASYRFAFGRSSLSPHLYYYPGPALGGGTSGAAASLAYIYGRPDDNFRLRSELGYGKRLGAALELGFDGKRDRVWLDSKHQPRGYASLGLANPHGTFIDAGWSRLLTDPLTLTLTGMLNRHQLPELTYRTQGGGGELRYAFTPEWALAGAAQLAWAKTSLSPDTIRTLTLPLTLSYQEAKLGVTAQARYQRHSQRNLGGPGGRLSASYRLGGVRLGGHADWQRDAATLDLVFQEIPELERAFTELGISASDAADAARLLRENPALSELGFLQGLSLNVNPWRFQSGAFAAWSSQDALRQTLRIQLLFDEARTVLGLRRVALASASYAMRAVGSLDLLGNLTGWTQRSSRGGEQPGWSFGVGLRWRIDDLPSFGAFRAQRIEGSVFRDEQVAGAYADGMQGVGNVRVRLDGGRETVSDAQGRFIFDDAGSGSHRVEAILPEGQGAFFTTGSSFSVESGDAVRVGIAFSPARLHGFVRSDANVPIAGVTVKLAGNEKEWVATTDSSGQYSFAVGDGAYRVSLQTDAVPEGYDLTAVQGERAVGLSAANPMRVDLLLPAHRAISGRVVGPGVDEGMVKLLEAGLTAPIDSDGRFLFRGVRPGTYTLSATRGRKRFERKVVVPEGPALLKGIDLAAGPPPN